MLKTTPRDRVKQRSLWKVSRQIAKNIIPPKLYFFISKHAIGFSHAAGIYSWSTKKYEFWILLQTLLYLIKPNSLIEFGSGRSTNYLAEYALKSGANLLSFEEHLFYFIKVNLALKLSFLPFGVVKYVPQRGGWYDRKRLCHYLDKIKEIDFLFYDGPSKSSSGERGSKDFYRYIVPKLSNVKLVIVDDVHRSEENAVAEYLVNNFGLKRFNIRPKNDDILAILLSKKHEEQIKQLPGFLKKLLEEIPQENKNTKLSY